MSRMESIPQDYSHGYIHCMPYGKVSLVIRLFPRQPGYVMTVCADASVAAAIVASIVKETILALCVVVLKVSKVRVDVRLSLTLTLIRRSRN